MLPTAHNQMTVALNCNHGRERMPPPPPGPPMLDEPELGGVYRGTVSSVMEFGCFVELKGFRRKVGACFVLVV